MAEVAEKAQWEDPVKAWTKEDEESSNAEKEEEEKKTFNSSYEIIVDYSEYSTIQGLIYIFFSYQTLFGRIFWIITIFLMTILGLFWCIQAYIDWQNQPVLTTITTTAYSVKSLEFPAVTICSPGMSNENLEAGYYKLFLLFLEENGAKIEVTPYAAAALLLKNSSDPNMSTADRDSQTLLKESLKGPLYTKFINEKFPGLSTSDDVLTIMKLMMSKSPDTAIAANVALDGGFNPCSNSTGLTTRRKRAATSGCNPGYIADSAMGFCYKVLSIQTYLQDAVQICTSQDGDVVQFSNEAQVTSFINLIKSGKIVLPEDYQDQFFLMSSRTPDGSFYVGDIAERYINNINVHPDINGTYHTCLSSFYDPASAVLETYPTDCWQKLGIICRKVLYIPPACTPTTKFVKQNPFDLSLDPKKQDDRKKAILQKKLDFRDMMFRLNQTNAFEALFSNLWYATLPCFDVKGITAERNGERSIIKYCEWKGTPISCASIFDTFPTDRGMCCSFNMKKADNIFKGDLYPKLVRYLGDTDTLASMTDSSPPTKYTEANEPKTLPGRNKGLFLMVDAHTNLLTPGSIDSDFDGFTGVIGPTGSFPMMGIEGFEIRPGYNNIISLSGSQVNADSELRKLAVTDRDCLFEDESSDMRLHKNYTYMNCIFECSLLYAKKKLQEDNNSTYSCIPWYFPSPDPLITMCDPWENVDFLNNMINNIPDNQCSYCLPDCSTTIYEPALYTIPFRRCDSGNLGVSRFCNLNNRNLPQPMKFSTQITNEYKARNMTPEYLSTMESNNRIYFETVQDGDVFTLNEKVYDAYEKDIALIQVYFRKSTVFEMGSQPRMTWIDYFSTVGGLLGLVLGMGIISVIELIWLCMRLGAKKWNLTEWVA